MTPPRSSAARAGIAGGPRAGIASPRRPAPAPDRPRHLEVVQGRPAPGRRPPRPVVLASVGVAAGIVLVIVVARVLTGQVGFTESDLTKRIAEQERRVSGLELSVARLQAPQRIYDRAIKLGLVPADRVVFLAQTPVPAVAKAAKAGPARPSPARPSTSPGRGGR